jgi:putative tributyrin esterase
MAMCDVKFFSKALVKQTAATVLLPESEVSGPFAVFYLLHGLSDDHTIWQRRTSIERYVSGLPLIVVMPDGGRGFYTDAKEGMAYESALIRDLIPFIDARFQTIPTREKRVIGGLSMGGYGAAKLALKYPDLFCSAVSHSGAVAFAQRLEQGERGPEWVREWTRVFGAKPVGGPDDLFALAANLKPEQRPALRIDCGTEDQLLDQNRDFHAHLEKIGYPHEYAEFPGAHDWAYWDIHVQEAIAFHTRHLKLEPKK